VPDPLAAVWERSDVEEARFNGDEAESWGDGAIDILARAGLVCRIENAHCVVCDACAEHHVEEVTYIESPEGSPVRAYIHCPEHGRIAVPLNRLRQWAVDFEGLATAAARGLDLAGSIEEVTGGRLWCLGKTTIGARSRDVFLARGTTWIDARRIFGPCERLDASRGALILVPGDMPPKQAWTGDPPSVVPLKLVAHLEDKRLAFERDHLESLLTGDRRRAPIKAQESFPTAPGTQWQDVMVSVTDSTITIEAKRRTRDFSFQAAGFEEKRKRGVPDGIWSLLKVFAMRGGVIPFDGADLDSSTRTNLKQYVSVLRRRLRALIPGIDGDPVPHVKEERGYRMPFKIASREGLTFPVPDGAAWPKVTMTLARSDAIRIAVPTAERFAASSYAKDRGDDVHQWEPAERESELEREYSLRMLGLTDENGRPDSRGAALLEVLGANGAVSRPADDDAMLELCGVLTKLMPGIDGSPFDFASGSEKWIALFQATSGMQ
jgi:hypothetical protein